MGDSVDWLSVDSSLWSIGEVLGSPARIRRHLSISSVDVNSRAGVQLSVGTVGASTDLLVTTSGLGNSDLTPESSRGFSVLSILVDDDVDAPGDKPLAASLRFLSIRMKSGPSGH